MAPTDSSSHLPPTAQSAVPIWVQENLFNTWYNGILIICLVVIAQVLSGVISWSFAAAQWTVIQTNLRLFFVGRFPQICTGVSGLPQQ